MIRKIKVIALVAFVAGLTETVFAQSATINKVWLEHNIIYNEEKCLKILVDFDIYGMKGKEISVNAYILDSDKNYIKGGSGNYSTTNGNIVTTTTDIPDDNSLNYFECPLFIPNRELPLLPGKRTYYVSVYIYDKNGKRFLNTSTKYASYTRTGSENNGAQQQVAQNRQQSLNYMDIHQKYSHSKYFNDWGTVVKSDKEGYTYFFVYNTGWVEGIKIEHCGVCHGRGGNSCPMCFGCGQKRELGFDYNFYYVTCQYCMGTGTMPCTVCKGNPTYGRVEALHDEGDGYIRYYIGNMFDGTKGQMSYINTKSSGGSPSGATIPIQSFQRYDNSSSGYDRSNNDYSRCNTCAGSGRCGSCAGRGESYNQYSGHYSDCAVCKGTGICPICHGRGKL